MRITFLGTGTSVGVPMIGCDCATCNDPRPENKRLRTSVYIEHPGGAFLIDCSTDFRQQALTHRMPHIDALLITHDHADHINGIDDLRGYNHMQKGPIDIYAAASVLETLTHRYAYCFNPTQIGGGVPQLNLRQISGGEPFELNGLTITPVPAKHGILDILGYRLGPRFAYMTDCSEVPGSSVELLQGVEVLVVNALRHTPHPTHFTLDQALEFSRRIAPKQTWFTHMTCHLEHFATNAALPPETQLLHDGQVIELPDAGAWEN